MHSFRPYQPGDIAACLALFDANCPEYFATNERDDYRAFLQEVPAYYQLCLQGDAIVGAFGLSGEPGQHSGLNWILLSPDAQGQGLGRAMMERVVSLAQAMESPVVEIGASHLSAPFFARFGAEIIARIENGWGEGMHRVDMQLQLTPGDQS